MYKNFKVKLIALQLLLLFCNTIQAQKIYNIVDFGAVADTLHINTKAIQSAIDKCAEDGGGTVVVPSGTFVTGAIFVKQGVNLEIKENGVLKGSLNPNDYKLVQTRWEGEEKVWISALVNAFSINGFRIVGRGTIDGSGDDWFLRRRGRSGITAHPRLIAIQNCSDVVVENLKFINQSSWGLFVLYSTKVDIRNLVIRAEHYIPSSDGIDIDSSNGVKIVNVDIDVNDDCISIKSGKDEDGRRVNRPAENILIDSCIFRYGHGGVAMGSEMSGGIRNVVISNSIMMADNWAPIRFKSQPSRGGIVENITYKNIKLVNTRQAFEFNMEWRMKPPLKDPSDPLPLVRNVKIINVSGDVKSVGVIHGLKNSPIENVIFENCNINAKRGLLLENVTNLDLSGLTIKVEEGDAVISNNVKSDN